MVERFGTVSGILVTYYFIGVAHHDIHPFAVISVTSQTCILSGILDGCALWKTVVCKVYLCNDGRPVISNILSRRTDPVRKKIAVIKKSEMSDLYCLLTG